MKGDVILKIRKILFFSLIFILIFAACSKKTENKHQVNVFMDIHEAATVDLVQKLSEDYKSINPKVSLNITSTLEPDSDIIFTTRAKMIGLVDKGSLTTLKGFIEENKIDDRYYKIVRLYGMYNDKEYGLPVTLSPLTIYYNKDALLKYGYNPPETIEDLNKLLSGLKNKSYEIPIVTNKEIMEADLFSFIVNNSIDVNILEKNFGAMATGYEKISEMKVPFDVLKSMIKNNIIGRFSFIKGNESTLVKLEKGEIPMVITSLELKGENVKAFENYSKGRIPVSSELLVSTYIGGKNGKDAEAFLKYLFSDDTQKKINEVGYITGNKANKSKISSLLENADEKNINYTDTIPENLLQAIQGRLEFIISGKVSEDEWKEIIKNVF